MENLWEKDQWQTYGLIFTIGHFYLARIGHFYLALTLAEFLGVSDAAASQMVDKLVDQGLILRIEDPQDRRGKLLSLSPEGNTIVQESIKSRHAWVTDLAELFTPEQEMQVQPALLLLIEKIKQMETEYPGDCTHKHSD